MDPLTTDSFRARLGEDIKKFHTRKAFDQAAWDDLVGRFHYLPAGFDDLGAFQTLKAEVARLDAQYQCRRQRPLLLRHRAALLRPALRAARTAPASRTAPAGSASSSRSRSAPTSPRRSSSTGRCSAHWHEDQIYRVDHYLGKETVQNLLAFRFSNGMFEPLWNKHYIDHIQFNVAEAVDVEGRGGYYDSSGVLRDMMQNHMFQMLAYLCMEPPGSFDADAIRNEKAKLLEAVRVYTPDEVQRYVVRGQYGPRLDEAGGTSSSRATAQEKDVDPAVADRDVRGGASCYIDNWRWEGVPIYLRSGKALWKRGTEIVVQFKKAPEVLFRGTPVAAASGPTGSSSTSSPYQGIEVRFQAKIPGPTLQLQTVNMRFGYGEAFKASRYTGYEVMIYSCMHGDATLFSRGDLVEAAWRIAQPILDTWKATPRRLPELRARHAGGRPPPPT